MFQISKFLKLQTKVTAFSVLLLLSLAVFMMEGAYAQCPDGTYQVGTHCPHYLIKVPSPWNGDLVVFAHGYVSPTEELAIVDYVIPPENKSVSEIVAGLGYAYATTSYSYNGLVIPQAVEDIRELVVQFPALAESTAPRNVYLVGASEGGLVTTLALEKYPGMFSGGLAFCGPVGDFRKQINYFGDFLVLFNHFFPHLLSSFAGGVTPTPAEIPDALVDQDTWDNIIEPAVLKAIHSNPSATSQLLRTANAPTDPDDPFSEETILGVLWYGIFATNDAVDKLGGSPYDNSHRWYSGSRKDLLLNLRIKRFHADAVALYNIENGFQTSGELTSPLVTAHTTQDPIVPYWHEPIYNLKTLFSGSLLRHLNIPVVRYGHCAFNQNELLTAFTIMVFMAGIY